MLSNIQNLIPHREPFVFVEKINAYDDLQIETQYTIPFQGLFISNNKISELLFVENVAQSAFALIHLYYKNYGGENLMEAQDLNGYISQSMQSNVYKLPNSGQILTTNVQMEFIYTSMEMKICEITAKVFCQDVITFETQMKMILQDQKK